MYQKFLNRTGLIQKESHEAALILTFIWTPRAAFSNQLNIKNRFLNCKKWKIWQEAKCITSSLSKSFLLYYSSFIALFPLCSFSPCFTFHTSFILFVFVKSFLFLFLIFPLLLLESKNSFSVSLSVFLFSYYLSHCLWQSKPKSL